MTHAEHSGYMTTATSPAPVCPVAAVQDPGGDTQHGCADTGGWRLCVIHAYNNLLAEVCWHHWVRTPARNT